MPRSGTSEKEGKGGKDGKRSVLGIKKTRQSIAKRNSKRGGNLGGAVPKKTTTKDKNNTKVQRVVSSVTAESPEDPVWRALLHNGVVFPPGYIPHSIPMKYDGKTIELGPRAEELASMFAVLEEEVYIEDVSFGPNFMRGLRRALKKEKSPAVVLVKNLKQCDFSIIRKHVKTNGIRYEKESEETRSLRKKCRYAIVDGSQEYVNGYDIPTPGILIGDKSGLVRDRVFPEDVTINIGEESPAPPCPMEGHKWGRVIHEKKELWVACWMDTAYGDEDYAELTGRKVRKMDGKTTPYSIFLENLGKPEATGK